MPSDLPDLDNHQQDQNPLPQQDPTPEAFRSKIIQLDNLAQSLKVEKAGLERQLRLVIEAIFANDNEIRRNMDSLGSQLFRDQRAERQSLFITSIVETENVIEGMYYQMQANPRLLRSINAIVKEEGTLQDNNMVAAAIMTELTGNTFQLGHNVSARVIEYEKARNEAMANLAQANADLGPQAFGNLVPIIDPAIIDAPADLSREQSVVVLGDDNGSAMSVMSPTVKSEAGSIATPYTVNNHAPGPATGLPNFSDNVSIRSTPETPAAPQNVVAHGMSSLARSFPGLLESINHATPDAATHARLIPAPPSTATKRGRDYRESDPSMSPPRGNVKKAKADKDAAISHTFINYMKHLEQLHRNGKPITNIIKCSRCNQIKRDVRVLNCLHLYCHRCVLQLRGQAQHGNAITGFNSTCIQAGCDQVVSGKTTVIDSEIIDFLQWYDQQSPAVTSMPCQLHVLNTAVAKYPKDDGIKAKLQQVQNQLRAMQNGPYGDPFVDLMIIAKLIRKPYVH